ncbi:MAG TPA: TerC family protein [Bryobacteraceae bacterium]|nr:TerC family protein [Bryobacteraceae bacterium]
MQPALFPFYEYWWAYLAFTGFVLAMLALDLGIFHRKAHAVSVREAATWSAVWIALSLLFSVFLHTFAKWEFARDARLIASPGFNASAAAWQVTLEFLTGYVIEKSLSVDNIFVFVIVFNFFAVPPRYQHRVLFYGIAGALVFRGVFIALGAVLMRYEWVVLLFGGFLVITGFRILFMPEKQPDPEHNPLVRLLRRVLPVTPEMHGQRFFVRVRGALHATPLLLTLAVIEASDIIFAIDSVPAIFAITREPLIVFTSNMFAILGLRALYFLLAGAIEKFTLLKYGLGLVLIFVGLKMAWLNAAFGGKFPIVWSLGIILGIVGGSIALSLLRTAPETVDHK